MSVSRAQLKLAARHLDDYADGIFAGATLVKHGRVTWPGGDGARDRRNYNELKRLVRQFKRAAGGPARHA